MSTCDRLSDCTCAGLGGLVGGVGFIVLRTGFEATAGLDGVLVWLGLAGMLGFGGGLGFDLMF